MHSRRHRLKSISVLGIISAIFSLQLHHVLCLTQCSDLEGGGVCPDKSTCCKIKSKSGHVGSGCIPNNNHVKEPGQCCADSPSACVGGYKCDTSSSIRKGEREYFCSKLTKSGEKVRQPRYQLIEATSASIGAIYGFPVHPKEKEDTITTYGNYLAYYSNKGPILTASPNDLIDSLVRVVVVIIHGSGRNADEYLYAGMVSSEIQKAYPSENVIVIAPRFLSELDGISGVSVPVFYNQRNPKIVTPMMWNETFPIAHTWRYGANAVNPSEDLSSYDAMDSIVEFFTANNRFQNLERIVVAGHSAGGQFTHRWALTSHSAAWYITGQDFYNRNLPHNDYTIQRHVRERMTRNTKSLILRAIVANPRSYCYLDGRRFINNTFQLPSKLAINDCPGYNQWEWGLEDGGRLPTPYRDQAIEDVDWNRTKLIERYAGRNVIYLSGENDTEALHGSCEDDHFQGKFRRERSERFFQSLQQLFGYQVHKRIEIKNVGHDHSLIFASDQGIKVIYGDDDTDSIS